MRFNDFYLNEKENYHGKDPKTRADIWEIDNNKNTGNTILKYILPPIDKLDIEKIIYKVVDNMGRIIKDESTIFPRPYFTNLDDAIKAMNSNKKGEKPEEDF